MNRKLKIYRLTLLPGDLIHHTHKQIYIIHIPEIGEKKNEKITTSSERERAVSRDS